ncbi:hypothetical protein BVC80_1719g29 [Macleaya cordata]|uniref:Avr9/Cf-9 rapidly elicited protein n=1 Tax=Macleaya cordata TaxID=56857 RepID=A0A200Q2L3_MACCD|nr:hypothetical protein BVC80_1719g29 [Macleaya cordata]
MNSIFSSFDAVCAEYLGQKIGFSFNNKMEMMKMRNNKGDDENINSKPPQTQVREPKQQQQKQQQRRTPRFAPELDGLNCFETMVSN